ncbi:MAG: GntR family transcriptional regulator [Fuerstiella sp.]
MTRGSETVPPRPDAGTERRALKHQAYSDLKQLILSGELPGGSVQSVRQLAARLKMSKTPVHAAIERLEAEGLVTLAPQQGVVVREMSVQDIVNHYEIRQALEPFVARRLAGRLTEPQVEQLRQNLNKLSQCAVARDTVGLMARDAEFHQLLCSFLRNDEITRVMRQLRDKVQRVVFQVAEQFPERVTETCDEHRGILDALVSGDPERASRLMYEHLGQGLRRFLPTR